VRIVLYFPGDKSIAAKADKMNLDCQLPNTDFVFLSLKEVNDFLERHFKASYQGLLQELESLRPLNQLLLIASLARASHKGYSFRRRCGREILGKHRPRNLESAHLFAKYFFSKMTLLRFIFLFLGLIRIPENLLLLFFKNYIKSRSIKLNALFEYWKPRLVVVQSSGFDPLSIAIRTYKSHFGFQILYLVNNWDNPSSKMILTKDLDYIGSWNHEQIHQISQKSSYPKERVHVVGSASIDEAYSRITPSYTFSHSNRAGSKLLFVGQQNECDELSHVTRLAFEISKGGTPYKGLVYRPHPISSEKLKRISQLDELQTLFKLDFSPSVDFSLYTGVICLPTTLILEVYLSGIPAIVYTPKDSKFRTDPFSMWRYEHFDNLKSILPFPAVHNFSDLMLQVRKGLPNYSKNIPAKFQEIFPRLEPDFCSRLVSLVARIDF